MILMPFSYRRHQGYLLEQRQRSGSVVGQWDLCDASGITAVAKVGSNGTYTPNSGGNPTGVTLATARLPGQGDMGRRCMTANGTSGYVAVPTWAAGTLIPGPFTIEAWVYSLENGREQHIADAGQNASQFHQFYKASDNKLRTSSWGSLVSAGTVPINAWTHVMLSATPDSTGQFYINGAASATTGTAGHAITLGSLRIGEFTSGGPYYWNGPIGPVTIHSGVTPVAFPTWAAYADWSNKRGRGLLAA